MIGDLSLEQQSILLVDDEKSNLKVLSSAFKGEASIILAKNGEQALAKAEKYQPDLILLDVVMPDISGFEVIKRLKKNSLTRAIPVIFITGLSDVDDEGRGLALGACDYIQKPFNIGIVQARVRLHLKLARQCVLLEHLASIDPLTTIANRRKFDEVFEQQWRIAIRERSPLSKVMIDIDYFKPYNDFYGHAAGDIALKKVANVIFQQLNRPSDFVARYGGEEFVVLLPNTDAEDAIKIMEACRRAIEELGVRHEQSAVNQYLTVSIGGVSSLLSPSCCPKETLKLADDALYKAKMNGRNRVLWYGDQS